jgi:hypothetical protein
MRIIWDLSTPTVIIDGKVEDTVHPYLVGHTQDGGFADLLGSGEGEEIYC